jgi:hypothetical protein
MFRFRHAAPERTQTPGPPDEFERWAPQRLTELALAGTTAVAVHRDGSWWYQTEPPPSDHRCRAHTVGFDQGLFIYRCSCGGIRGQVWVERNTRTRTAGGERR